ncbi:MAG: photosynthetic reaction center subunit H [Myxococcota bacterium]
MPTGAITEYIDVAQVCLYVFWLFFAGLIFWIRINDRREGYPLEREDTGWIFGKTPLLWPQRKEYLLPNGETYVVPNDTRDTREVKAKPVWPNMGSALQPTGNPMTDCVGPASYTERHDEPEMTITGEALIVPMRVAEGFKLSKNSGDPRGTPVEAADGQVAGKVKDLWVDRADFDVRYLEIELNDGGTRLVPMPMVKYNRFRNKVDVASILSTQFGDVPTTAKPDQITALEEDKIMAYYGGGHLYAYPARLGPLL